MERNRIKRRLREALRAQLKDVQTHYDIVVIAQRAALDAEFSGIQKIITRFFSESMHENHYNTTH